MKTSAIGLLSLSAMLVACGGGASAVSGRSVVVPSATTSTTSAALGGAHAAALPEASAGELGLQAGDYVVYRFSGSFRKAPAAPLTLTQRVLGRDGAVVSLEVVLDDGRKQETLRIRKDATPGSAEEVFDVTRVDAGVARSATVDAYAALMAKTVLAADQNEAELGTETTSVRIGDRTLRCKKTSYRVRVGKHEATMSTVESEAFPWGDVAGDITTADGQVLYRVEVLEAGSGARDGAVAAIR
jgi:hypothetical protein